MQVCAMLGISCQALAKRRRTGSLLGLRGQRTTWFPAWQFNQPADWIAQGLDDGMVITAAHRAAEHFTQRPDGNSQ